MRRTGKTCVVPAIGSVGCATLKTVPDPPSEALVWGVAVAQPAIVARPAIAPVDNTFLRSMTLSPVSIDGTRGGRATLPTMISRFWFYTYFAFSHRSADGEAIA